MDTGEHPLCLKGSLLLADPALRDPNFHRTVILLTEHQHDTGAHGYILNRPCGQNAGELLSSPEFKPLGTVPVFHGGPVSNDQLTFASFTWDPGAGTLHYATHLTRDDAVERLHRGEQVRAFIGYSGWSEGQLENEIRHRSWIIARPEDNITHPAQCTPALWAGVLDRMGPWFRLLSRAPEDPGLN